MFYRDHGPPHFHASYGDYAVTVSIRDAIATGRFPKRALNLVSEWCALHKEELLEIGNWLNNENRLEELSPWSKYHD